MNSITLSELNLKIQDAIRLNFSKPIWIRSEINELHENNAGHCYMELIEKDNDSDVILAKSKANCWASIYRMLKPYFQSETGQMLRAGIKVLLAVTIEYHEVYGLSLQIRDIDPTYTIGEMAARRLQIIRKLELEGIMDMNKQLQMPDLPQRIAIISSSTAAGFGDFTDQLQHNTSKYIFYPVLFPAIMQGDLAESSIITALEKIYACIEYFDVVVIIRGGGGATDLACFNSYELALNCAQFPLPIIAGIGHQRDVSILDMVSHTSIKTPTAVAEFLISSLFNTEKKLNALSNDIVESVLEKTQKRSQILLDFKLQIRQTLQSLFTNKSYEQAQYNSRLKSALKFIITEQQNKLSAIEKNIAVFSPTYLLKHGYSITSCNGKRIFSVSEIKHGDRLRTYLSDGYVESDVNTN